MRTILVGFLGFIACFDVFGQSLRFAVIGDYGVDNSNEAAVAKLVKSWAPDLVLTVGDNNYPVGSSLTIDRNIGKYYHSFIFPYVGSYGPGAGSENRFFPVLGNHDFDVSPKPYLKYFTLPGNERYYDFVRGDVHFFMLNSCTGEPDGRNERSTQAEWLRKKLSGSTSKFNFVFMHHPPYSSDSDHNSELELQWPFQAWGADAVFAGHNHFYERLSIEGLPYFINGLGGQSLYGIIKVHPSSQVTYQENYGAQLVEVQQDRSIIKFFNIKNEKKDQYTLKNHRARF